MTPFNDQLSTFNQNKCRIGFRIEVIWTLLYARMFALDPFRSFWHQTKVFIIAFQILFLHYNIDVMNPTGVSFSHIDDYTHPIVPFDCDIASFGFGLQNVVSGTDFIFDIAYGKLFVIDVR